MRTFYPILGFFSFNNLYCISFSDSKYNIQHLKILIAIMIIIIVIIVPSKRDIAVHTYNPNTLSRGRDRRIRRLELI